jgi:hypothetical protein
MIKEIFIRFVRNLFFFSSAVGLFLLVLTFIVPAKFVTPALPAQYILLVAVTALVSHILLRSSLGKFNRFLNIFLLITVLKLGFFFVVIILYSFMNRPDAAAFAISFFILYFFFSIFEVIALLSNFKKLQTGKK